MSKVGVVFSNLGTPKSPTPDDVGRYLGEFLMDHHVIQLPYLLRLLLVRGLIVPRRKQQSAQNYAKIWRGEGSPLFVETDKAAKALQKELGSHYKVVVGMRYGEPNFAQCRDELKDCSEIIFFPQYPQYAASTVQTAVDHFFRFFDKNKVKVINPFFEHPAFLKAYGRFLKKYFKDIEFDHLLMSFHGLPESHLAMADKGGQHCLVTSDCCARAEGEVLKTCYRAQCYRSARGIAQELGLKEKEYTVSFQSRLGRQKWIEPYTENTYGSLAELGVRRLAVICPGFPVDGLETLEEIAMTGRKAFLQKGGESFTYIPCLNDDPIWIEACAEMVKNP